MVSPTFSSPSSSPGPAPLAWKEFRRRSGINALPKVYVYDASPQIVPHSPTAAASLTLSPLLTAAPLGQESPRKDHSGYLVSHVTQALQSLGASTGGNIAEYIASNFNTEQGVPYEKGRKLHYMVNAILSSPKYKYIFLKDQILKDEKRSLWRLKQPGDTEEESAAAASSSSSSSTPLQLSLASLIPSSASLSSLIPASPALSIHPADAEPPATPLVPPSSSLEDRECGGGSDENRDDKKHGSAPRTTEHPPICVLPSSSPSSPVSSPSSPLSTPSSPPTTSPPFSMSPSSPAQSDVPMSLSSRRRKRKGSAVDLSSSSSSVELSVPSAKTPTEDQEKKRRLDIAAA